MRLPVKSLAGVIRRRPSAPHPPLSAAGASQFSHSDAEGTQLRRIPPNRAQDAAIFLIPKVFDCARARPACHAAVS